MCVYSCGSATADDCVCVCVLYRTSKTHNHTMRILQHMRMGCDERAHLGFANITHSEEKFLVATTPYQHMRTQTHANIICTRRCAHKHTSVNICVRLHSCTIFCASASNVDALSAFRTTVQVIFGHQCVRIVQQQAVTGSPQRGKTTACTTHTMRNARQNVHGESVRCVGSECVFIFSRQNVESKFDRNGCIRSFM